MEPEKIFRKGGGIKEENTYKKGIVGVNSFTPGKRFV